MTARERILLALAVVGFLCFRLPLALLLRERAVAEGARA